MYSFIFNCVAGQKLKKHPIPAESKGGQQQDHKDQESVAFMHCGPVLS